MTLLLPQGSPWGGPDLPRRPMHRWGAAGLRKLGSCTLAAFPKNICFLVSSVPRSPVLPDCTPHPGGFPEHPVPKSFLA